MDEQYETLLKSFFNSCDIGETGFLSFVEFRNLCFELNLEQKDYDSLNQNLFKNRTTVNYQDFKSGLLQLLSGELGTDDATNPFNYEVNEVIDENIHDEESAQDFVDSFRKSSEKKCSPLGGSEKYRSSKDIRRSRTRKYGRKSKVEEADNMKKSTSRKESKRFLENEDNRKSKSKKRIDEELITQADGDTWIIPEYEASSKLNEETINPREALSTIWEQVIGDLNEPINVEQLQQLYHALSLNSSKSDLYQLFNMLDVDDDGLICFSDFAQQIPAYSSSVKENYENESSFANNDDYFAQDKNQSDEKQRGRKEKSLGSIQAFDPCDAIDLISPQSYTGPRQQRRRHKNQKRNNLKAKGRSALGVSLPYYHPVYKRKMFELPLHYLTDDDERHVRADRLISIWKNEGIENCEEIIEKLGINPDEQFSIEVFSESIEQELNSNKIHQAICALYKNGIKHYRSQIEKEDNEKEDLVKEVENLQTRIKELGEKFLQSEEDYRKKLLQITKDKQINSLRKSTNLEIENERNARKKIEIEVLEFREKVPKLKQIEKELKMKVEYFEEECNRLKIQLQRKDEVSKQSEDLLMQQNESLRFLTACFQQSKQENLSQHQRFEEIFLELKYNREKTEKRNREIENVLNKITSRLQPQGECSDILKTRSTNLNKLDHLTSTPNLRPSISDSGLSDSFLNFASSFIADSSKQNGL